MRGTRALESEILVLEARKSDEPFIKGFRDLQERRAFLESISIDTDALSAVTVDAAAKTPYRSERPRKFLLMFVAAMLGLLFGILLVFIAEFKLKVCDERENGRV